MSEIAALLRVAPSSWQTSPEGALPRAALSVVFAFVLLAWNRFAAQGIVEPRASVRLILIGIYGWLAMSIAIWFIARFSLGISVPLQRVLSVTGVAHVPLIVLGGILQLAGVIFRWFLPGFIATFIVFGLWMPSMILAGFRHLLGLDTKRAFTVVSVPYIGWLVTVGAVLQRQLGHLI